MKIGRIEDVTPIPTDCTRRKPPNCLVASQQNLTYFLAGPLKNQRFFFQCLCHGGLSVPGGWSFRPMEVDDEALEAQLLRLCSCGDTAAAALLLRSVPANVLPAALELRDRDKRTPLLAAGAAGSLELVRLLLEAGADAEASDSDGCGLALLAASSGNPELLAWLVHQGWSMLERLQRSRSGEGPHRSFRSVCSLPGLADLTESAHDGSTALLCAASHEAGAVEMLHFLLDGPPGALVVPSLEEQDERGAVPAARVLLSRGASPESRDARGSCALHYAAAGGSSSMVDFCVKSLRIPVDVVDSDGDTPLMIAAHEGNVEAREGQSFVRDAPERL
eukprot:s8372_g1.t3